MAHTQMLTDTPEPKNTKTKTTKTTMRLGAGAFLAIVVLLVGAMAAWACTNLATLNLEQPSGAPGTTIDVTGSAFRTAERGGQEVVIHWNGSDGPVLATAVPDATGNIATAVTIPADATPGYYVLVATQNEVDSETGEISAAYGTPARASFLVGSTAPADIAEPVPASAVVTPTGSSTGMILLTVLLALAGVGLFGAGLGLFVREVRRRGVPAPVERD